ncbi:unnamed protein product [Meloidogyne enterolobii]|uniref:Uncharacterized protein n=1 Tax=Meloidogyne enterolobii TaxID=390850 RepID=A0ACB0Z4K8_MELEN
MGWGLMIYWLLMKIGLKVIVLVMYLLRRVLMRDLLRRFTSTRNHWKLCIRMVWGLMMYWLLMKRLSLVIFVMQHLLRDLLMRVLMVDLLSGKLMRILLVMFPQIKII